MNDIQNGAFLSGETDLLIQKAITGASYTTSSGTTSYNLAGVPVVVPEPSTFALGMVGAVIIKRRKK